MKHSPTKRSTVKGMLDAGGKKAIGKQVGEGGNPSQLRKVLRRVERTRRRDNEEKTAALQRGEKNSWERPNSEATLEKKPKISGSAGTRIKKEGLPTGWKKRVVPSSVEKER